MHGHGSKQSMFYLHLIYTVFLYFLFVFVSHVLQNRKYAIFKEKRATLSPDNISPNLPFRIFVLTPFIIVHFCYSDNASYKQEVCAKAGSDFIQISGNRQSTVG